MKSNHITFGGIFASLIVVLISLSYVIPGIEMLFVLFLPFLSSYISFKFGFKKSLPFMVGSLILSLLISYINAILYVFPSLISGICFGTLIKKVKNLVDLTFIMSFVEGVLFALSIFVISKIFSMNISKDISSLLNMNKHKFDNNIYLFLFIIGLAQALLTSIIIVYNYKKLNFIDVNWKSGKIIFFANLASIILMIIFINNSALLRLFYGVYFVTLITQVISSFNVSVKYNWIYIAIQIITFLFISIPVLTIINDGLKLFVYSWFLLPLIAKNCLQVFNFKK